MIEGIGFDDLARTICEESMAHTKPPASSRDKPGHWVADDTDVHSGGQVGGDAQVGDSYSVRYRRSDRPEAMITRTAYVVEVAGCPGAYTIQVETEWLVCTDPCDPGGSEDWSETVRESEPQTYGSPEEADNAARQVAAELLADGASHDWDGSFW